MKILSENFPDFFPKYNYYVTHPKNRETIAAWSQ